MSENSRISTSKAPKALGLYPHARKVGNLLFLSGVGPRVAGSDATDSEVPGLKLDKSGNFIEFDFEAQCRSVFGSCLIDEILFSTHSKTFRFEKYSIPSRFSICKELITKDSSFLISKRFTSS